MRSDTCLADVIGRPKINRQQSDTFNWLLLFKVKNVEIRFIIFSQSQSLQRHNSKARHVLIWICYLKASRFKQLS